MKDKKTILLLASAATLTLALNQGVLAEPAAIDPVPPAPEQPAQAQPASTAPAEPAGTAPVSAPPTEAATGSAEAAPASTTTPTAPAPVVAPPDAVPQPSGAAPTQPAATAPTSPPPAMTEARERMEQRRAEMMQERKRRYDELRTRAAEVGLELPETPPWDQPGMQPPQMPAAPEAAMPKIPGGNRSLMTPEERNAIREQRYQMMRERAKQRGVEMPETPPWKLMNDEERQAHLEKMRNMTPEERRAMRDQRWEDMRQRAQEQGVEMPETPPWKQAEQRRAEMKARWDSYRETLDAMTQEQKEAVQAIFGRAQQRSAPPALGRQVPPGMPMQTPYGPQGSGYPQGWGMPGLGYGGGQPMLPGRAQGWNGGNQGGLQGPPPPPANYNQRW